MARGKIGIALGGGAARGWAHIGVLRALAQYGIVPDIIAGTSIGAVVGGCFAAGRLDELEGFARDLTKRKIFGYLDFNLSGSGLITGQRVMERLENHLKDVQIEDMETKFVAVATEFGTGQEAWISRGSLVQAMRASYALPGIFKPVQINNRWLFDGALCNPVPASVCRALGARYVIAVNLNADACGRGNRYSEVDGLGTPRSRRGSPCRDAACRAASAPATCSSASSSADRTADPASPPSWSTPSTSSRIGSRARGSPATRPT